MANLQTQEVDSEEGYDPQWTRVAYGYNGNGDVSLLVSLEDNEGTVATYAYGPFGQTLQSAGWLAPHNPMRFSTQRALMQNGGDAVLLPETGHLLYLHRLYHITLGRFTSQDPIGEAGGLNLYAMCGNDCVNYFDISGFRRGQGPNQDSNRSVLSPRGGGSGHALIPPKGNVIETYPMPDLQDAFVSHYFFGHGAPVDLMEWGLWHTFMLAPDVQRSTRAFRKEVKASVDMAGLYQPETILGRSFDVVDVTPQIFAVGHSTLTRSFNCTNNGGTYNCILTFEIHDMFEKPLDHGLGFDPGIEIWGGTPYPINLTWNERLESTCPK